MRLLFLTSVYPSPAQPSRGTFNHCLVRALTLEHEVRVIAPVSWIVASRLTGRSESGAELPEHLLPALHPTYYYPPKLIRHTYGWFLWHSVRATVTQLFRSFHPDAVLGYWAHPDGAAALKAARLADVPMGLIVGGSDILLLTRDPKRRKAIVRVLVEADAIFPVGSDLRARVMGLGIPPSKLHDLRQGVDTERFNPHGRRAARQRLGLPQGTPVLLWVGHMVPVKGLDVLLQACRRLAQAGSDFRLYLVGDGPLRPHLEASARAFGLSERIHFVGAVGHDDLPDWYRAADLTVLASHSEGVPNVLLESLACGTPFMATRVGSIAELAQDVSTDLVAPGDPDSLAGALGSRLRIRSLDDGTAIVRFRWSDTASNVVRVLSSLRTE